MDSMGDGECGRMGQKKGVLGKGGVYCDLFLVLNFLV